MKLQTTFNIDFHTKKLIYDPIKTYKCQSLELDLTLRNLHPFPNCFPALAVNRAWINLCVRLAGWRYQTLGAGPQVLEIWAVLPVCSSGESAQGGCWVTPPHCLPSVSHSQSGISLLPLLSAPHLPH